MISIFNGRSRSLGSGETSTVYLQLAVTFREHLHLLKGARLAVFLAIALHSDEDGWAYPSTGLLVRESGYGEDRVFNALRELCEMEINGSRVLLRSSGRTRTHRRGTAAHNHYLIFPNAADVRRFEVEGELPPALDGDIGKHKQGVLPAATDDSLEASPETQTIPRKSDTDYLGTENVCTDFQGTKYNQTGSITSSEPEPPSQPHTHTAPDASASSAPAAPGVRVGSRFTLEQCLAYAETQPEVRDPRALALVLHRSGDADLFIARFLDPPPVERSVMLDPKQCPDCRGSGWCYPEGHGNPVARCAHAPLLADLRERAEEQSRGSP